MNDTHIDDVLDRSISEIQRAYDAATDPEMLERLLVLEKQGQKRKMLNRWLKKRIKDLRYRAREREATTPPRQSHVDAVTGIRQIR